MGSEWEILFVSAFVFAIVGNAIGSPKGRSLQGFLLGGLFSIIGVIIIAVMEPTEEVKAHRQAEQAQLMAAAMGVTAGGATRPCPWCAEQIQPAAVVCKHCGREVKALGPGDPQWAADPHGRHEFRFWDGTAWTSSVSSHGVQATDPVS